MPAQLPTMSHLVLNVRDIEASHQFYTEYLGFEQSGQYIPTERSGPVDMRFYRGSSDHHHEIALVQVADPENAPPRPEFRMFPTHPGIVHIAMDYGSRDAFLAQIEHLQACGVPFRYRVNHGMTHSAYIVDPDGTGIEVLYDLPREVWEGNVNAALSYGEILETEGPEALEDSTDYRVFT
jgi:catechol 2,3-dioxygenase